MRSRKTIPRIVTRAGADGKSDDRLLILENESEAVGGRPVGPQVRQEIAGRDGSTSFSRSSTDQLAAPRATLISTVCRAPVSSCPWMPLIARYALNK